MYLLIDINMYHRVLTINFEFYITLRIYFLNLFSLFFYLCHVLYFLSTIAEIHLWTIRTTSNYLIWYDIRIFDSCKILVQSCEICRKESPSESTLHFIFRRCHEEVSYMSPSFLQSRRGLVTGGSEMERMGLLFYI